MQAFLNKYRFILRGIGILAVFYVAFGTQIDMRRNGDYLKWIQVVLLENTNITEEFTVLNLEDSIQFAVKLDYSSSKLIEIDTTFGSGTNALIALHIEDYATLKRHQTNTIYIVSIDDIDYPEFSNDRVAIINRKWQSFNRLFLFALFVLLFLDLVTKNKEEILDWLDEFASKVNAKTDSITLGSTEYQLYRDHLIEIGYRGQFKRPIIRKRFIEKLKEPTYTLKSEKYVLLRYFLIALLGLTFVFISKNGPFQEKLTTVIPLLILQLLSGVIYIGSNKVKKELIISNKGIKQSGKEFIPWSLVEFVYLYKGDKDIPISLLLKAYDYNEPAIVDISGLSMSPKKIGHLVATFIEN